MSVNTFNKTIAQMKISRGLICLSFLLGCGLLSGCATQTRLGQIIPAHRLSEHEKNEMVLISVVEGKKAIPRGDDSSGTVNRRSLAGAPVAAMAAGLAIDFVKSEMEKEAERYETQFGKKAWLTTDDLKSNGTYVVLTRWVNRRADVFWDPVRGDQTDKVRCDLNTLTGGNAKTVIEALNIRDKTGTRELVFLLAVELMPSGDNSRPFTIRPALLWSWKSKAKIVAFDYGSVWKPWKWIGTIFFKGDSKVNYKVDLEIESLVRIKSKDGDAVIPAMVKTGPADPIIPQLTHQLGKPVSHISEDRVGGWFDIPDYKENKGYFTIQIKVTESDASNIRKKLVEGAEYLGKNKQSLVEKLVDGN